MNHLVSTWIKSTPCSHQWILFSNNICFLSTGPSYWYQHRVYNRDVPITILPWPRGRGGSGRQDNTNRHWRRQCNDLCWIRSGKKHILISLLVPEGISIWCHLITVYYSCKEIVSAHVQYLFIVVNVCVALYTKNNMFEIFITPFLVLVSHVRICRSFKCRLSYSY